MEKAQELKQGKNELNIVGVVKEHKLKYNEDKENNYINGSLVIKAGEFTEITLGVYVKEKTKKGKTSKVFNTLNNFINDEYLTMANIDNEGQPTKVRVYGNGDFTPQFKEDIYKGQNNNEVVTQLKTELSFGNIVIDNNIKEEDYKANFDIEVYIRNIVEEMDKEQVPTGRAIVHGILPVYGGKVVPLQMIAGTIVDEKSGETYNLGEDFLNEVDLGTTYNLWGKINFQSIIEKKRKGGTLGKAKIEEKRTYIHELIIEGGDIATTEFDEELIKKAMTQREGEIEEVKNQESTDKPKSKGLNKNSTNRPKRQRPKF